MYIPYLESVHLPLHTSFPKWHLLVFLVLLVFPLVIVHLRADRATIGGGLRTAVTAL